MKKPELRRLAFCIGVTIDVLAGFVALALLRFDPHAALVAIFSAALPCLMYFAVKD